MCTYVIDSNALPRWVTSGVPSCVHPAPVSLPILLLGTTSGGKIREYRDLLAELPVRLAVPPEVGINFDVEEGDRSFAENAALKARAYHAATGLLTVAEDSGFVVDALGGEPGVRSARWGETDDYGAKNRLILERMTGVPPPERTCHYVAHLAIVEPDGQLHRRSGSLTGFVAAEPAGSGGFGYDPIFWLPEYGQTLAQLDPNEKNQISHRARAVRDAMPLLRALVARLAGRPTSS